MNSEIRDYLAHLDYLHSYMAAILTGLDAEALNWRPEFPEGADPTNSLAVLGVHVAGSQHYWIGELIGGLPPTRDRPAEFAFVAQSASEVLEELEATQAESREVLTALTAEDLDRAVSFRDKSATVRRVLFHMLDHIALHLGHMQITYQMLKDGKAGPDQSWFASLPDAE